MTNKDELLRLLKERQAASTTPKPQTVPVVADTNLTEIIDRLEEQMALIEALASEKEMMMQRLTALETRMPPTLEGGRLPTDLTELECQIFHTPLDLIPADHRRVKTEWSLRLTGYIGEKRAKPDLNIRLFSGRKFWNQVMLLSEHPPYAEQMAEAIRDRGDVLGGMLTAITKQKGRPYIPTQFCILMGHLNDTPSAIVNVDGQEIAFQGFRRGKGTKANRAKWYAKVRL